jgi:Xaa-Pro aminopeptidase
MAPKSVPSFPARTIRDAQRYPLSVFVRTSDFFYLTGFEEPDALAVVKLEGDKKYTLFVRPRDPEREIWDGRRAGC